MGSPSGSRAAGATKQLGPGLGLGGRQHPRSIEIVARMASNNGGPMIPPHMADSLDPLSSSYAGPPLSLPLLDTKSSDQRGAAMGADADGDTSVAARARGASQGGSVSVGGEGGEGGDRAVGHASGGGRGSFGAATTAAAAVAAVDGVGGEEAASEVRGLGTRRRLWPPFVMRFVLVLCRGSWPSLSCSALDGSSGC